ncbi:cysteine desulfurase family protein [Millisia brevis]|uniref:cysteine desulfurase family protein n=1 Tax=Millisia brevis TaxID=264148 RepID=UPI0008355E34|nr:cysteine desulfurase family protein [Millisia brevis]
MTGNPAQSRGAESSAIYLDHAATTPMVPAAVEAMVDVMARVGNASSVHGAGRAARRRLEEARESIARDLGARPSEVIFTTGGTESLNLALKGIFWARRDADPRRRRILASSVEHHAVIDTVEWLVAHEGAEVTWLPVDARGVVTPETLAAELAAHADEIALVTIMWANNEVGSIMPIAELAELTRAAGIPFHTDAVQAVGILPVDFGSGAFSALSLTAHKFGGPTGVGALLLRRDVACVPLLHGGGQERDVRSGTLDVAGAASMAAALHQAVDRREAAAAELSRLRDALIAGIVRVAPDAVINGPLTDRLPGNVHVSFPGCEGDSLLMLLDAAGVEVSTGSACTSGVATPSHVLSAMGIERAAARGSLRLSLGHTSTDADVAGAVAALPSVLARARAAGLAAVGGR